MTPSRSHLSLPNGSETHFVHIINDLLSPGECEKIVLSHTENLVRINGTYTTRLREVYEDEDLAELLWERLRPFYTGFQVVDEEGCKWTACGMNPKLRFCKYSPGDGFGPHYDARYLGSLDTQSFLTVNMYLNTVPSDCGGTTRVLDPGSQKAGFDERGPFEVLAKIPPTLGSAAVFRDLLFHDGEALTAGVKYLLRSDVMFSRDVPFNFDAMYGGLETKEERGRKALYWARRLEDSGMRDDAVWWYRKAFKICPELESEA